MPDNRIPTNQSQIDIKEAINALITALQSTKTVTDIIPITWSDFQNVPIAEKEANCWRVSNHPEPQIDGDQVSYDSNNTVKDMINGYKIVCDSYVSKTGITSNTAFNLDFDNANIKSTDIPMIAMTVSGTSANSITFRSFIENGRVRVNTYPLSTDANAVVGYWIIVIRKV